MDQQKRRDELYGLLGRLPSRTREISVTKVFEEERDSFILEKLMLDLNGTELVPAYFLRSKKAAGKAPVILYNHASGGEYLGKSELLEGRRVLQRPPYAEVLTELGISVLAIDCWGFEERKSEIDEMDQMKEWLWKGQFIWGMMVYDSIRAVDYLVSRPDVEAARIGTLGLSMGSTMAWWLAALDTRIKVTVDICCLTDYESLIEEKGLSGHGIYYYVPDLLNHFTTAQINELIVPRPHLSLAGDRDQLTPVKGLIKIDRELQKAYREHNAADAWKLLRYDVGHEETPEMRAEILSFVQKWL